MDDSFSTEYMAYKSTVVNRTDSYMNGELLEITSIVQALKGLST
jgi:hypothetical protein